MWGVQYYLAAATAVDGPQLDGSIAGACGELRGAWVPAVWLDNVSVWTAWRGVPWLRC